MSKHKTTAKTSSITPAQLREIGKRVLDATDDAAPEGDIQAGLGAVFGFFPQEKQAAFCEAVGRAAVVAVVKVVNGKR